MGEGLSTNLLRVKRGLSHANLMGVTDFKKKIQNLERALDIIQSLPPTPQNLTSQKQLCSEINDLLEIWKPKYEDFS